MAVFGEFVPCVQPPSCAVHRCCGQTKKYKYIYIYKNIIIPEKHFRDLFFQLFCSYWFTSLSVFWVGGWPGGKGAMSCGPAPGGGAQGQREGAGKMVPGPGAPGREGNEDPRPTLLPGFGHI